jgi:hypothetical protein
MRRLLLRIESRRAIRGVVRLSVRFLAQGLRQLDWFYQDFSLGLADIHPISPY